MKKHFLTGLAILLPVTLTAIILNFLLNLLTRPFEGLVRMLARELAPYFPFVGTEAFLYLGSRLIVLALLFIGIVFVGSIAENFIVRHFFQALDRILKKMPMINRVYHALQEVMRTFFHEKSTSFSQVVLVPFPGLETHQIGFITSGSTPDESDERFRPLVSVFVPGTPNPTMGFMLLYKKEDIIYLDTKVEDGFKFVVSCGILGNQFQTIPTPKHP